MKIIGVNGLIEGGKSTVADYLVENYGYQKMSFSTALKESTMNLFGLTPDQVFTTKGKATVDDFWGITPREILQRYGTESIREVFGYDFWVRVLDKKIRSMNPDSKIVVDDVRFLEESELIKSYGGQIWHVYRKKIYPENRIQKIKRCILEFLKLKTKVHKSELPLPDSIIDKVLDNTKDYEWIHGQIRNQFESFDNKFSV